MNVWPSVTFIKIKKQHRQTVESFVTMATDADSTPAAFKTVRDLNITEGNATWKIQQYIAVRLHKINNMMK